MKMEEEKSITNEKEEDEIDDDDEDEDCDTETDSEFESTTEPRHSDLLSTSGISKSMEIDSPHVNSAAARDLGELEVASSSGVSVESKDNTENFQVVSMDSFDSSVQQSSVTTGGAGVVNQRENYSHQVLTVYEATGQLILMTATGPPPQQPNSAPLPTSRNLEDEKRVLDNDNEDSSSIVESSSVTTQQPIISIQNTSTVDQTDGGGAATTFDGQQVDASQLQTLVTTSQQQQRQIVPSHQLQQVSIGQILNQEGVTIASLPIQSVQGVGLSLIHI